MPSWRPLVTVNAAVSLDGRIAGRGGRTLRLSDREDLQRVHRMRAAHDAILVGIGTVLADDPALVIKHEYHAEGGRDPMRVVLDSHHRTPLTARVASGTPPTLIYSVGTEDRIERLRKMHGVEVVACPRDASGRVDLEAALGDLKARGIESLMVEGGSRVLASFFRAGYVDRVTLFVAPVLIGEGAPPLVAVEAEDAGTPLAGFTLVHATGRLSGAVVHLLPDEAPR